MTLPVVRFAPSPTGRLHIGNARTALLNWLVAKRSGGRFVLRFDDTDVARSREEHVEAIARDLRWLGIAPDLVVRQSARVEFYASAVAKLKESGRLYPAYETADELDRRRRRQIARGAPPIYDRAALRLSAEERAQLEAGGRSPHWRFKLEETTIEWDDLVRGPSRVDCASLSDPVLVREDGAYLYTLPSVVDDIALGISAVIRGEDHVTNTGPQIQIFRALGGPVPAFGHHNLLTTASGEGLSKRSGALSLESLREAGIEPLALAALAVLTGTSESIRPVASFDELAGLVDLARISRHAARFDPAELATLSARTLHAMPFEAVQARLADLPVPADRAAAFWQAVRGNLAVFADAGYWAQVAFGEIEPDIEDAGFAAAARDALPAEPWSEATWGTWTKLVAQQTQRRGRALFHPLRLALTGRDNGPELAALLPLIGGAKARARLSGSYA
jgi:glutamyl-tRNA synthetase